MISGRLAAAGLDVPQALLESRKVILSPHQGSSTLEITPHRIAYFVGALTEHFG